MSTVANPVMNADSLTPTPVPQIHFLGMLHGCYSDNSQEADVFVRTAIFLAIASFQCDGYLNSTNEWEPHNLPVLLLYLFESFLSEF